MEEKKEISKHDSKLIIDLSQEYKIKIENPEDLERSFFRDIYLNGADVVDSIIEQPERGPKLDKNDPFLNEKQDYNNIIAFCGERGTGKSSAMISFAQSLLRLKDSRESQMFYKGKKLVTKDFRTIQVIDPSLFEEHENIFEVILAQLFSSFEKELSKKDKGSDVTAKRELLEQFEKVYENLQTIRKDGQKYDGEALETLDKLACGANLRQNFKELVKRYLDFIVGKGASDSTYLIIPIDDFDLNVNAAAEMAEHIRKYLMIPNVIILLAVKIEQLIIAKEQKVREDFKTLLDYRALPEDPKEITLKYIGKLVPSNRRIEMPVLNGALTDSKFQLITKSDQEIYKNIFEGFQVSFFYKTSAIISSKEFFDIELFPRTLRELKDFFVVLNGADSGDRIVEFLISQFCERQLDQAPLIRKLLLLPTYERNQFIIKSITELISRDYKKNKKDLFGEFGALTNMSLDLKEIIEKEAKSFNVTLGDLLLFFKGVEDSDYHVSYKNLIDVIKLLYSIWSSNYFENNKTENILELMNGSVYNPGYKEVIRKNRSKFQINRNILSSKPNEENANLINWLVYFIEYPQSSSYKRSAIPFYQKQLDIGSGRFLTPMFNVLNMFTTCISPDLQTKRANWGDELTNMLASDADNIDAKVKNWLVNRKFVFPIFNVFVYEKLLWEIDTDYKEKASFSDLLSFLFSQIQHFLVELENNEPLFRRYEVVDAFCSCPLIIPILTEDEAYSKFLDSLPKEQENTISFLRNKIKESRRQTLRLLSKDIQKWSKAVLMNQDYDELMNIIEENVDIMEKPKELKDLVYSYIDSLQMKYE